MYSIYSTTLPYRGFSNVVNRGFRNNLDFSSTETFRAISEQRNLMGFELLS